MPLYRYSAINKNGFIVSGYVVSASYHAAIEKLQKSDLDPVSVFRKIAYRLQLNSILSDQMIRFFLYLEYSVASGIPLANAITSIIPSLHKRFAAIISSVHENMIAGQLFSQACAEFNFVFSPTINALLQAGEHSGQLCKSCQRVRKYIEEDRCQKIKIAKAVRYPIFCIMVFALATICFVWFFIPQLVTFFESQKTELPTSTTILIFLSNVSFFDVAIWASVFSSIVSLLIYVTAPASTKFCQKMFFSLKMFGIFAEIKYVRFLHSLALLSQENVHFLHALHVSKESLSSLYLAEKVDAISDMVKNGEQISSAMKNLPNFKPFYLQIIHSGEMTGRLGHAIEQAHLMAYQDLENKIEKAISFIEPALLLIIGALFLFLISATLMPFYEQIGSLGNGAV